MSTILRPQGRRYMRRYLMLPIASVVMSLTTACGKENMQRETAAVTGRDAAPVALVANTLAMSAAQVAHGGVKWAAVVATNARGRLELTAQLMPNEDRTSQLGAPAQGRVITVHVKVGDRVVAGQPLVTLHSPDASAARADYEKAVAQVASARAQAAFAQGERERAERLLAIKAASRVEVERAQTDDQVARGSVQQAEAELLRARSAREQLGATSASGAMVLRSPMRGVVLSRNVVPGSVAEVGTPLVAVTDAGTLWLEIAVSDRDIGAIREGARARFTVPAFPADTFEAGVQNIGGALDTTSRTIPVRAVVQNADGRLRPAMFATVWIDAGANRSVIMLPSDAIQQLDNRSVVFVARIDTKGGASFERRDVEVGSAVGAQTQVLRGLRAGEMVVVAGAFAIKSEFARPQMAKE